uniref:Uncharacterized protein n=1 Tax=Chromera velia CCMP2878 TaxID=1169474 RepID=A0A0G4HGK9_9ALVE|eukprot:Cvel_6727.t1-p1 / transcript=Cvel_6727.t1 / gene=Cvel_6727 / organism=Chromera_velia_CCMP2878 / gene_product=hypothetical protein / transcript_product=hypothetical protein / location=Cvel_scaffold336:41318-41755(-) / protein_length=146 / sequence_SO=supercontig / SO=protein_coding / is_pseudo=false
MRSALSFFVTAFFLLSLTLTEGRQSLKLQKGSTDGDFKIELTHSTGPVAPPFFKSTTITVEKGKVIKTTVLSPYQNEKYNTIVGKVKNILGAQDTLSTDKPVKGHRMGGSKHWVTMTDGTDVLTGGEEEYGQETLAQVQTLLEELL